MEMTFVPDRAVEASTHKFKTTLAEFEAIYQANCRKAKGRELSPEENAREIMNIKERLV